MPSRGPTLVERVRSLMTPASSRRSFVPTRRTGDRAADRAAEFADRLKAAVSRS